MNTGPSKLLPCPQCGKMIRARGMDAHLRLMHGTRVQQYKSDIRPTQLELGLSEGKSTKAALNGVKTRKKGKSYTSYSPKQGSQLLETLILGLGVAWILHEIAKNVKETAGKEKSVSPPMGKNATIILK